MLFLALGAWSCSEAHLFNNDEKQSDAARALGAAEYAVGLRTGERGTYVVAEEGGGGAVNANRPARGAWETFTLRDLNGGALQHGDEVALRSTDGHCERPLYLRYDRDDPQWWDVLVQELLASRVNVVMAPRVLPPETGGSSTTSSGRTSPVLVAGAAAASSSAKVSHGPAAARFALTPTPPPSSATT